MWHKSLYCPIFEAFVPKDYAKTNPLTMIKVVNYCLDVKILSNATLRSSEVGDQHNNTWQGEEV